MKLKIIYSLILISIFLSTQAKAIAQFIPEAPLETQSYKINAKALCETAQETLAYLNKGTQYDARVIHDGKALSIPLTRVKATLVFICQHQSELNDPLFLKKHFEFIRWYPDKPAVLKSKQSLAAKLPPNKILMTKYYVPRVHAANQKTDSFPIALYALPQDEALLTLKQADANPQLTRFQYGKQAILKGALTHKKVPVLAYLNRDDFETALMQGTLVAQYPDHTTKVFNVHRGNNIPYNKTQNPYQQERYWYFKPVQGIKGYGKDADYKITVNPEVTFAADLEQFGLGKMLLIQYQEPNKGTMTRAGIFADTGGAFQNNSYQVDFLAGTYATTKDFYKAVNTLPNYVSAYFMVLKDKLPISH